MHRNRKPCNYMHFFMVNMTNSMNCRHLGPTTMQGSKLKKKFQVTLRRLSKKKWSPNAKMQSPDTTRIETQIRASFNQNCCLASGRLWLWLWDRLKYSIWDDLKARKKNSGRLQHENLTLCSTNKIIYYKNISGLLQPRTTASVISHAQNCTKH